MNLPSVSSKVFVGAGLADLVRKNLKFIGKIRPYSTHLGQDKHLNDDGRVHCGDERVRHAPNDDVHFEPQRVPRVALQFVVRPTVPPSLRNQDDHSHSPSAQISLGVICALADG